MKLGFIDYYLDEYHANNYPKWIKEATGGELQVAYAYAKIDSPKGGMTTEQWCGTYGIRQLSSMEDLIEKSDGIIVLAPDNPEQHEELCRLPMQSGKPVYADKTFAETKAEAERIFALGEAHNTPCYSSSALRYAEEFRGIDRKLVENIISRGPGPVDAYSVHQLEPVVALMGTDFIRVQYTGTAKWPSYICEYRDGRRAAVSHHGWECPFGMALDFTDGTTKIITVESDCYKGLINGMSDFFRTREVKVPHGETVAAIALREAAIKASAAPGEWIKV